MANVKYAALSAEVRADLFNTVHRAEAVVMKMGVQLAQAGHTWSDEDRRAFDWVARNLEKTTVELAA